MQRNDGWGFLRQSNVCFLEQGIVTLAVEGEFEVKLGVMSDNLFASWHVYKTKLFLRDPEEPGMMRWSMFSSSIWKITEIRSTFVFLEQELVHPVQVSECLHGSETDLHLVLLQMQKLTNYIQSWLIESENPLVELYRYLRRFNSPTFPFSSSLTFLSYRLLLPIFTLACSFRTGTSRAGNFERTTLWFLSCFQAHRIRNRSAKQKHLHLSSYIPCKSFNVEYWKECHITANTAQSQKKPTGNEKSRGRWLSLQVGWKFHACW